jgi:acyl-homoserine lactone acylase PvdQ
LVLSLAVGIGSIAEVQSAETSVDPIALAQSVTIYRDAWGVPHIDGPTDESVVFGFGYCQAEDYFWQLEDSYLLGLGRYAEVDGKTGLQSDLINRAFEIPQRSQADYGALEADVRSICEAFVAGINYYLDQHPQVQPRILRRFEPWYMLAFARQVVLEMGWSKVGVARDSVPTAFEEIATAQGSNAWAIAPHKTAGDNAMLFCNPHQPYYGFGQFYEGHLRSGEGWNFSGATFFGSPLPTIGHNEHLGWSCTVNNPRIGNTWKVVFDDPGHPLNYRYDGGYRTATQWTEKVKVLSKDGNLEEQTLTLRKTHLGPIVKKIDDTTYLAANIGKFYDAFALRQNLAMVRARNLDDFRQAMSKLEFHIFNFIYADRAGNIFYLYNGIVPRRDLSLDWNQPVDGADPKSEWRGVHSLQDLPQVLNPPSGYIQNCNQTPFTTTDDGSPYVDDFPKYMVRELHEDKRRAKVSRMLLRDMRQVTFEDWSKACYDTKVYWAYTELPKYKLAFEELKQRNPQLASSVAPFFQHLLDWDCVGSVDSTQTTLCVAWYEKLYGDMYRSETLLPKFLEDPDLRFQALLDAAQALEKTFGSWKIPYGEINRMQRHANVANFFKIPFSDKAESIPSAGLNGPVGCVFNMFFTPSMPLLGFKKHYAVVGNSYVSVIEFGDRIEAASVLQYGNSGDPRSPHFFDQAKLVSQKKFKPQWFYWDDVIQNAQRVYHPGETPTPVAQAVGAGG